MLRLTSSGTCTSSVAGAVVPFASHSYMEKNDCTHNSCRFNSVKKAIVMGKRVPQGWSSANFGETRMKYPEVVRDGNNQDQLE